MGDRTRHPPGTFSWAELVTTDAGSAKAFYTALLGWDYDDQPVGDDAVYSMAARDGKQVAALYTDAGQPPHWNSYVTVASADEAAARATESGGSVVAEPFEVMTFGRMAVLADPVGATLCLWEPREHIGAALVNAPGALTWNDLMTPDPDGAVSYYGALFGWTAEEIPGAGGYRVIRNGERSNGGIMPLAPDSGSPPSWLPYFGHEDVDRVVEAIGGLGGSVYNGPIQVPAGRFAVLGDPQGAAFAVLTGEYDD
jgi:uncharacterized protein